MRIFIITQEENLFLPLNLLRVIDFYKDEIIGVVVLKDTAERNLKKLFYCGGLFDSLKIAFKIYLNKLRGRTVKNLFKNNDIKVYNCKNINSKRFILLLKKLKVDLLVSISSTQIFKKQLIRAPKKGCINVHGSLLPKYRGRDIAFWVLYNKEKETGETVHYINEKVDQGGIILQKKIKIEPNETVCSLYKKTVPLSGEVLIKAISLIKNGKVRPYKQKNISRYKQYSAPSLKEIMKFKMSGLNFFRRCFPVLL